MNCDSFRAGVIMTYLRLSDILLPLTTIDLLERGTGIVQSLRVVPGASLSILPPHAPTQPAGSTSPIRYLDNTRSAVKRRVSSTTRLCCGAVSCGNIGNDTICAATFSQTGKSPTA